MKTVEQLIFEKRFKDAEFDPNDYNDWAKENEYEAYTLCLAVAKQLQQHLVMQAEGSDVSEGAAVASEGYGEANKCVDAGCPQCKNTDIYDIDDHWTKCNNCGFTFVG